MRSLVGVFFIVSVCAAQTPEEVIARLAQSEQSRTAALRDYEVLRRYSVSGDRFGQRADMEVRVNYTYPGSKQIDVIWESGSGLLRTRVFRKLIDAELEATREEVREQCRIDPRNYEFHMLGKEVLNGRPAYVMELKPRRHSKFLVRGKVWLDVEDAAVVRLEGSPAGGTSFWVRKLNMVQTYRKVGQFWLVDANHTDADVRLFGPAQLSVQYYDYQVNRSLVAQR